MNKLHALLIEQNELLLVAMVLGILLILIIPFPPIVLDFLLCLNISLAMLLLLLTLTLKHPLEFSTFPSILLLTTLFRLALNVASTRLILLKGYAGSVIQSFGFFVVGGDPLVGFIIFLILVIIQFIVITKGANRISEVAARFTLDAMPGKQMSIDADLNTGSITEAVARQRRKDVSQEAEFYGAMDGAGKFVRGDAIAGIIIIIINILGGFILGLRKGIPVVEALKTYVILTVGDGLVSQIPALLISVTTGVLTTKTASEISLADDLKLQLGRYPKAIAMTAGAIFCFGIIPGLPTIPFWGISAFLATIFHYTNKTKQTKELDLANAEKEEKREQELPPSEDQWLALDRIRVELGYKLIELANTKIQPTLMDRIVMLREQLAREFGILAPPIHIVDDMQLSPNNYAIKLEGEKIAEAVLYPDYFLAIDSGIDENLPSGFGDDSIGEKQEITGIETREPAFGLAAKWIDSSQKESAESQGYTVINAVSVLITHLSEVLKKHAYQILTRDDVHFLLDITKRKTPKLLENIIPDIFSIAEVQQVLQNLLWEKVSVLNLPRILETLSFNASKTRDVNQLTELVRQNLSRSICSRYQGKDGILPVITIAPSTEQKLREVIAPDKSSSPVALDPEFLQKMVNIIADIKKQAVMLEGEPILLVNMDVRRGIKEIIHHSLSDVGVLSFQEVMQVPELKCIGTIDNNA